MSRPVAIVFEGKRYTFSQLNERVSRLANALLNLGIGYNELPRNPMGKVLKQVLREQYGKA